MDWVYSSFSYKQADGRGVCQGGQALDVVWIAFIGGAVSFAHCLGMCGGFALHLAAGQSKVGTLARQLLWHFGRITTYVFLGALAGFLGNRVSLAQWPWVRDVPGYLAGTVMIVMGLALLGLLPWGGTGARNAEEGVFASVFRHFFGAPSPLSALGLGLYPLTSALAGAFAALTLIFAASVKLFMEFGINLYTVNYISMRHRITPDAMLGRVTATMRGIGVSAAPVGAMAGGVIAEHIGIAPTMLLVSAANILLWLAAIRYMPSEPGAK